MTAVGTPIGKVGGATPPAARRLRRRDFTFDRVSFFLVFLIVPVVGYVVFVVSPFAQAAYYSLTNWSGFSPGMDFVGFSNYTKLFQDQTFLQSMGNSVALAIVLPLVTLGIAFLFASLITIGGPSNGPIRGLRNSSVYRVITFFPYVVPAIVIGLIWKQIYDPSSGLLNGFLTGIGLDQFGKHEAGLVGGNLEARAVVVRQDQAGLGIAGDGAADVDIAVTAAAGGQAERARQRNAGTQGGTNHNFSKKGEGQGAQPEAPSRMLESLPIILEHLTSPGLIRVCIAV